MYIENGSAISMSSKKAVGQIEVLKSFSHCLRYIREADLCITTSL